MERERLENYHIIENQIKNFEKQYNLKSYIAGVDTTKPAVQSGSVSDPTADLALNNLKVRQEYDRLLKEYAILTDYIFNAESEIVKGILIRKYVFGKSWAEICADMSRGANKYSVKHLQRLLRNYLKKH